MSKVHNTPAPTLSSLFRRDDSKLCGASPTHSIEIRQVSIVETPTMLLSRVAHCGGNLQARPHFVSYRYLGEGARFPVNRPCSGALGIMMGLKGVKRGSRMGKSYEKNVGGRHAEYILLTSPPYPQDPF